MRIHNSQNHWLEHQNRMEFINKLKTCCVTGINLTWLQQWSANNEKVSNSWCVNPSRQGNQLPPTIDSLICSEVALRLSGDAIPKSDRAVPAGGDDNLSGAVGDAGVDAALMSFEHRNPDANTDILMTTSVLRTLWQNQRIATISVHLRACQLFLWINYTFRLWVF